MGGGRNYFSLQRNKKVIAGMLTVRKYISFKIQKVISQKNFIPHHANDLLTDLANWVKGTF